VGADGWKNQDIKDKIWQLKNEGHKVIHPQKYVIDEDLPALYSGAHALLHVAIHEGFGLPPVQAQACGTYVIVSDLPVLREIVDSKSALFVDSTSVGAIVKCLKKSPFKHQTHPHPKFTWRNTVLEIRHLIGKM
jgi:glycosyltransferase involved in cell wall biosynthesis